MQMISEHRPNFPDLAEIATRAGQDEAAVREMFGSVQDVLNTLAEQGLVKFLDVCLRTVTQAPADDPVAQFRAIGEAYLTWAFESQAQFRLLQHGKLVDLEGNENLARYVRSMHDVMLRLLKSAQQNGQIDPQVDAHAILITGRSLLFGLARLGIDGNMTEWHPRQTPQDAALSAFGNYMDTMAIAGENARQVRAKARARKNLR